MFDTIFAKKEDAGSVPAVRLVTIWFGASLSLPSHPPSPEGQLLPPQALLYPLSNPREQLPLLPNPSPRSAPR